MRARGGAIGGWVAIAAVIAVCVAGICAGTAGAAGRCRPAGRVLARNNTVVLWSTLVRGQTNVYLCAQSRGGAARVAAGGRFLSPRVGRLKAAARFASFVLTTTMNENQNLVVFDFVRGRRVLTQYLGCEATHACVFAQGDALTQYALGANGWVAEAWSLGARYMETPSALDGQRAIVATNDGVHFYPVDFGLASFSPFSMSAGILRWDTNFGGASSVQVGAGLIPGSPQPIQPCQVLTAGELGPVLGSSSSSTVSGSCTYTSSTTPAMNLTVGYVTGMTSAQQSAAQSALQSAGWDYRLSGFGGIRGYERATTVGGAAHEQLSAFLNGVQLSMDLTAPGSAAPQQLAWLAYVAFDRLFALPVSRAV